MLINPFLAEVLKIGKTAAPLNISIIRNTARPSKSFQAHTGRMIKDLFDCIDGINISIFRNTARPSESFQAHTGRVTSLAFKLYYYR